MPEHQKFIEVPRVVNGVETQVRIAVNDSGGPHWGPNDKHTLINKPLPRVDGPVKVTGFAIYTYDVKLPGMLYGAVLTSPHAHARVTHFDAAPAMKIKGVRGVVRANSNLAYQGAPVAAVAAVSREIAEDALRAIVVHYEVLPHVVKAAEAMRPDAPRVFSHHQGNVRVWGRHGDAHAVEHAIEKSHARVDATYHTSTIHHCCLETHGLTVDYRGGKKATVYASTQGTFTIPGDSARTLGLHQGDVTAIVQHMGGGFGSKFGIGAEGSLACQLSRKLKAPVKLLLSRRAEFLMAGNRGRSLQKFKAGVNSDGKIQAVHVEQYRLGGVGSGSQADQPYLYHAPHVYRQMASIYTNEDSSRAMRAPGHPEASYAIESLVDELAYKIGMDPVEFRKKNLTDAVWHRQLDRAAAEIGWHRRNPKAGGNAGHLKRGFGCAVGAWGGGGGPHCKVTVHVKRDGRVTASVGSQDLGTGTRTYIRAIVAEEFGLGMEDVLEEIGDSKLGAANASGGSTTAASLAPAVKDAAYKARNAMAKRVAQVWQVQPTEIVFSGRQVLTTGKKMTWKQACATLPAAGISEQGEWQYGLSGGGVHGACCAEVEVDIETGHVRPIHMVHVQDVGLPLNRLALESQINGGMLQGMGMALLEGRVTDGRLGVMLNPDMETYKIAGTLEIPRMTPLIDDKDTRQQVIGVGEPAIIPSCGAVANAVFNASGVRVRHLPITPDKILMGLQQQA